MEEINIVKQIDEDIEYNQMINTIDNLSDKLEKLKEENIKLKRFKANLLNVHYGFISGEIYKRRLDKAIEYIERELIPFGNEWHWDNSAIEDSVLDVLSILRGDKK